jgi:hypothetical protein
MRSMRLRPFLMACLAALAASGCKNVSPAGTFFASQPPGAHVVIDGKDSGWVTPCMIALDEDDDYSVRIELDGYRTRELALEASTRVAFVPWRYGQLGTKPYPRFPLFLDMGSLVLPYRENDAHSPSRIFVRLEPEGATE